MFDKVLSTPVLVIRRVYYLKSLTDWTLSLFQKIS